MADFDEKPTVVDPLVLPSSPIRAVPKPGTRIGKYLVQSLLGTGGMGVVVAARHEQLGELVAIKLMHAKAAKNEQSAERFAREAKQTLRIKSERVVRVLDAGTHDETGAPYIVMEYLEGRDLGRVLAEDGPLHPTVCVDLMLQVCEALAAAHALGIVHRDLKPSNFFLTTSADGSPLVKVLDFGISKALAPDVSEAKLTETQAVFGSPTYMSPEQIRSSTNVDQRSDVWSLGVSMFELLTGKIPFMADNVAGLLASIVADPPFQVSDFAPNVPPQLEAVVFGCLEKDASRRIQSVAVLASALHPFASSSTEAAAITGRIQRLVRASQAPGFLPAAAVAVSTPRSIPAPAISSRPSAPAPMLDFSKTTGTDLSATGETMKRLRGGGGATAVIVAAAVAGALVVLLAVVSVVYLRHAREAKNAKSAEADVAPPPAAASIAPPASAALVVAATAPVASASTPEVTGAAASAKPAATGHGKTRPGAAKASPQAPVSAAVSPTPSPTPTPVQTSDTTNSRY